MSGIMFNGGSMASVAQDAGSGSGGAGLTGLNPSLAKANIQDFNNSASRACSNLSNVFRDFSGELKTLWSSPKAAQFSNDFAMSARELSDAITKNVNSIDEGACSAFNRMASANGVSTIAVSGKVKMDTDYPQLTEVDSSGVVGMDVEKVRQLLDTFNNNMKNSANEFNSLPTSIALYDTADGQRKAYSSRVHQFGGEVEKLAQAVTNRVVHDMETELQKTVQAKQAAVESLGSFSVKE